MTHVRAFLFNPRLTNDLQTGMSHLPVKSLRRFPLPVFGAQGFPVLFSLELLASSSLMAVRFVVDKANVTFHIADSWMWMWGYPTFRLHRLGHGVLVRELKNDVTFGTVPYQHAPPLGMLASITCLGLATLRCLGLVPLSTWAWYLSGD